MNWILFVFAIIILIIIIATMFRKKEVSYGVKSETDRGETVRSKKEKIIADYLNSKNIEYEYEKKLELGEDTMLTDFYLPRYKIYVEYWGLDQLDNKTGDDYRRRKAEKIELYDKHNLLLISLNEGDVDDIENVFPRKLDELIKSQGKSDRSSSLRNVLFGKSERAEFHCTKCGARMNYDGEFCSDCGSEESLFCDKCGEKQPAGTEFCSSCGNKFS